MTPSHSCHLKLAKTSSNNQLTINSLNKIKKINIAINCEPPLILRTSSKEGKRTNNKNSVILHINIMDTSVKKIVL